MFPGVVSQSIADRFLHGAAFVVAKPSQQFNGRLRVGGEPRAPRKRHGARADSTCGLLHYGTKNADLVTMPFTVNHPNGFATFSFELIKGVNPVALPAVPPTSGPVATAVSPITASVTALMGSCDIAGFAELVYVAATANNGWGRQSQYDASAAIAFVLAP